MKKSFLFLLALSLTLLILVGCGENDPENTTTEQTTVTTTAPATSTAPPVTTTAPVTTTVPPVTTTVPPVTTTVPPVTTTEPTVTTTEPTVTTAPITTETPPPITDPYTAGLVFELNPQKNAYIVSDYNGTDTAVVLPALYEGKPLVSIAENAFYNCAALSSIEIPASVTSIGQSAFWGCSALSCVIFEENSQLKKIGLYAFYDCDSLISIEIPSSVSELGDWIFEECDNIESIAFSLASMPSYSTGGFRLGYLFDTVYINGYHYPKVPDCLKTVVITGGERIPEDAFINCASITSIILPSSITVIDRYAFDGCAGLTDIIFKEGTQLQSIGSYAFDDCESLTSITIPASVTVIDPYAFSDCTALTINVEAAEKPANWDNDWNSLNCPVVWDCKNNDVANDGNIYTLTEGVRYAIMNGVATVARQPKALITVTIPASISYKGASYPVTSIIESAFLDCIGLTSVEFLASVSSIGKGAFEGCDNLTSVTLPFVGAMLNGTQNTHFGYIFGASTYEDNAAYVPASLKAVVIKEGKIANYAFKNCNSITSVSIPASATRVGAYAFSGCTSLASVSFEENCQLNSILLFSFSGCRNLASFEIPASVTSISQGAFTDCDSLTSMIIPKSVITINGSAFENCESLTIYAEVSEKPSGWSFSNCPVVWDYKNNTVAEDGNIYVIIDGLRYAIKNKVATVSKQPRNLAISPFSIPSSISYQENTYPVTSIEAYAFANCTNIKALYIPASITSIGTCAFENALYALYSEASSEPAGWESGWNRSVKLTYLGVGECGVTSDGIYWVKTGSVISIIGYNGNTTALFVPKAIDDVAVTKIYTGAFIDCDNLTSIYIPSSVKSIGQYAFESCESLTIYVEAASKPSNWHDNWNASNCPVVWGYEIDS